MTSRWISGPDEVVALAEFTGRAIAAAGQSSYIHPGDVFHRTFGGNRHLAPQRCIRVWEDDAGIAAWVLLQPKHGGFDLQVRPDRRDVDWEAELAAWALHALRDLLNEQGKEAKECVADAYTDDPIRIAALESSGWARSDDSYFLTARATAEPFAVELAAGYTIRSAAGLEEAETIAALHAAAFGSTWSPGEYAAYMSNPGYRTDRELLAVAPDGELAAFTVTWHDPNSGTGLFEPVGTHPDHRKLGLGRALMAAGVNAMAAAGIHTATVMFEGTNPGSRSLYLGSGFAVAHELVDYTKAMAG